MDSSQHEQHERELPMLAGIAGIFHWLEELLNIVNGPVLMFGAGIALVDLLTDGALTANTPALLFTWAVSQALGIDTQLLGCFARARTTPGWRKAGWLVLGVILGFATWQAGDVFAVQQSQHISEAAALAQLGVSPEVWLGWRAFLAVGLVALSGWTRYRRPAQIALADERASLERELTLEPLRQQLRLRQMGGLRSLAETALRGAEAAATAPGGIGAPGQFEPTGGLLTASQDGAGAVSMSEPSPSPSPDRPPTGPGAPTVAPRGSSNPRKATRPAVLRLPSPARQDKRTAARANARSGRTAEAKIRAALASVPDMDFDELVKRTGVSRSSASKWVRVIQAERGQVAQ